MDFNIPTPQQIPFGLRALMTVARADGELAEPEAAVIRAAQLTFGNDQPVDRIETIEPAALAEAITDPRLRFQLFGGLVVMAMADGEVNDAEANIVARFAAALSIEDAAVANLKRIAKGQLRRARLDILRRQWAPRKIAEMARKDGVGVYFQAALSLLNIKDDPETIMKYQALGEMPQGSLGRAYFDYMVSNDFAFPGTKGAPPEAMLFHDLTHVLSGYGTEPEEEILVATFSAGYSSTEVVDWLVFVLSQFQLGLQTAPNVPPEKLAMNPVRLIAALRRGAAMNTDLNEGWDPWPVLAEPLDVVRKRLNILPESQFLPDSERRPDP